MSGTGYARKRGRLTKSADFDRVYKRGRSQANRYLVAYRFDSGLKDQGPRLGLSVSRKVGGAVQRNKIKRLLKEAFWEIDRGVTCDHDYVLVARPDIAELAERDGLSGIKEALAQLVENDQQDGGP